MAKIAFLGAGAMGLHVIRNFLKAGHETTVYNRSRKNLSILKDAGAIISATPKEAVQDAEYIFAMVRDDQASQAVWFGENGAAYGLTAATVAIEMSTLSAGWVDVLASDIVKTGAGFLVAPVLGTRPQAEAARLIYLAGGDAGVLEKVRPVLESTSSAVHYVGTYRQAAAMKLAVNALYGVQVAIWAEMLALLATQGIDNYKAVEILNTLPTTSPALQVAGSLIAAQKYMPMFPIQLVEKDFGYAVDMAQAGGIDAKTLKVVRDVYAEAMRRGFGDDNIVGVAQIHSR